MTETPSPADALLPPDWDALIAERIAAMPPPCEHEFQGWREFEDGRGGEQFCAKCGTGAMYWSMWNV